ncbi:hypothetical protein ABIE82_003800 [Bradyrhizobium diazoefficiens]
MRFLTTFQIADFADTLVSLFTAFVLGTLIGAAPSGSIASAPRACAPTCWSRWVRPPSSISPCT